MPSTVAESVIHVAAGVIGEHGRFFVTRRAAGAHQGGKWEFPGGKIHAGETVRAALQRELHEELGIVVQDAQPFTQVPYAYPEKSVLLDVWRVTAYTGTPHGREGQEARWASRDELLTLDFPEADRPIQRRLWLPRLYAISDAACYGRDEFLRRLELALAAGLKLLQLREPALNHGDYLTLAHAVRALCHRYHAKLLLNADLDMVDEVGADGIHLTSRRLMQTLSRPWPVDRFVAASCHNEHELAQAQKIGADLVVLGPVVATASHPDSVPLGWDRFDQLQKTSALAVYALGGMSATDVDTSTTRGAQGVAMIRGLWEAPDPASVVTQCERDND